MYLLKKICLFSLFFMVIAGSAIFIFMLHPQFGKAPTGSRLERIQKSPNYVNGKFQNQNPKPVLTQGVTSFDLWKDFLFRDKPFNEPTRELPFIKTNLHGLMPQEDVLIWFGHSSYFMQVNGKKILVDPVFSPNAGPVSFFVKAFPGTNPYAPEDMPKIDYLFITHDHWDHLDYATVTALNTKVDKIVCSLGVGEHLEHWGVEPQKIIETDWYDQINLEKDLIVHVMPTHHFSGRTFKRNQTLWASYVLQFPERTIYIGGDSGYDTHFAEIGERFGSIDLAILENGQYNERWKYTHMHPEEVLQAAQDLKAKTVFPVHSGKFSLSYHAWYDPLKTITALYNDLPKNQENRFPLRLVTPKIGEPVNLQNESQQFSRWWEEVQ